MQGLAPSDFSTPALGAGTQTTPEDGSAASSPAGEPTNHNTLADLSAQFRLLELDGSADSLDQVRSSWDYPDVHKAPLKMHSLDRKISAILYR